MLAASTGWTDDAEGDVSAAMHAHVEMVSDVALLGEQP
jgi:hypothetical protein